MTASQALGAPGGAIAPAVPDSHAKLASKYSPSGWPPGGRSSVRMGSTAVDISVRHSHVCVINIGSRRPLQARLGTAQAVMWHGGAAAESAEHGAG